MSSSSSSMSSSSSSELASGMVRLLRSLTDEAVSPDDRFRLVAQVITATAENSKEEIQIVQGKVHTLESKNRELELSLERAQQEIQCFSDREKARLETEVKKALISLESKRKIFIVTTEISVFGGVINWFGMGLSALFPIAFAVTVPAEILLAGVGILSVRKINSLDEKIWILQNYPEALNDDEIRKKASKECWKKRRAEQPITP